MSQWPRRRNVFDWINLQPKSSIPSGSLWGNVYFDDGSNTLSDAAGLRIYANDRWNDIPNQWHSTFATVVSDNTGNNATVDRVRSWYVVNGKLCTYNVSLRITSTAGMTATDTVRFSAPFVMRSAETNTTTVRARAQGTVGYLTIFTVPGTGKQIGARIEQNYSYFVLISSDWSGTGKAVQVQDLGTNSAVDVSITYPIRV